MEDFAIVDRLRKAPTPSGNMEKLLFNEKHFSHFHTLSRTYILTSWYFRKWFSTILSDIKYTVLLIESFFEADSDFESPMKIRIRCINSFFKNESGILFVSEFIFICEESRRRFSFRYFLKKIQLRRIHYIFELHE